jgi:hypothetical protein
MTGAFEHDLRAICGLLRLRREELATIPWQFEVPIPEQQRRGGTKRSVTLAKSAEVAKIEGKPV